MNQVSLDTNLIVRIVYVVTIHVTIHVEVFTLSQITTYNE